MQSVWHRFLDCCKTISIALQEHAQKLHSCLNAVKADPSRAAPKVRLAELVFEGLRLRAQHLSGTGSLGPSGATWLPESSDSQSMAQLLVSCHVT